jgi:hypothetical protein
MLELPIIMNIEWWNSFFQWGSVALIAVTFIFGAGALWTSNQINAHQTERLVALETDLAKAQERAALAEASVLELRQKMSPRHLSDAQEAHLIEKLKEFGGQSVAVVEYGLSREASDFSKEIEATLKQAGWTTKVTGIMSGVEQPAGVLILVAKYQPEVPAAGALANALQTIGVEGVRYSFDGGFRPDPIPKGSILLFVGPKP